MLWTTAIGIIFFKKIWFVAIIFFRLPLSVPLFLLVSVSIPFLLKVRLQAKVESWGRKRRHSRYGKPLGQKRTHGIGKRECRRRIFLDLSSLNLLRSEICRLSSVQSDVLLKDQGVCELLVAHRTLMQYSHGWFGSVHSHVCLQVALSCEGAAAYFTLERSLACVCSIMHLQRTLAR